MRPKCLCTIVLLLSAAPAAMADVVAASNITEPVSFSSYFTGIGYSNPPNWTNEAAGQRFVADVGGTVTTLAATVRPGQPDGVPLRVALHSAIGDLPGPQLGEVLVAPEDGPSGQDIITFDLSSAAIDLVAGFSYVAVFSVDTPIFQATRYSARRIISSVPFGIRPLTSPDAGASWITSSLDYEIGLTVSVVPEPSTLSIFALLLAAAARRRP